MHPAVAVDRELLLATAHRHEAELSSEALFGILIAAGELVDPGTLPTAADLDINDVIVGEHTADVPAGVVRARRFQRRPGDAARDVVAEGCLPSIRVDRHEHRLDSDRRGQVRQEEHQPDDAGQGQQHGDRHGHLRDELRPARGGTAVRRRLQYHAAATGSVAERFACARAARELASVELELTRPPRPAQPTR